MNIFSKKPDIFSKKIIQLKKLKIYNGFTLIEMIVAVSIFTIVVFISIGALLSISDANRKANILRSVMDNLNFAMENMARSVRTGNGYLCNGVGNCSGGKDNFTFTNQEGKPVTYSFYETNGKGTIEISKNGGNNLRITSPEVDIDKLTFYVSGVGTDGKQPKVTITIIGTAGIKDKFKTSFSIQTTVSQRVVDS